MGRHSVTPVNCTLYYITEKAEGCRIVAYTCNNIICACVGAFLTHHARYSRGYKRYPSICIMRIIVLYSPLKLHCSSYICAHAPSCTNLSIYIIYIYTPVLKDYIRVHLYTVGRMDGHVAPGRKMI